MKIKSYYIYSVGTFKTSNGEHLLAKSRQGHFFQSKQTQRGNPLSYQDCNSNLPLASILLKMFLILSDAVDIFPSRRKKKNPFYKISHLCWLLKFWCGLLQRSPVTPLLMWLYSQWSRLMFYKSKSRESYHKEDRFLHLILAAYYVISVFKITRDLNSKFDYIVWLVSLHYLWFICIVSLLLIVISPRHHALNVQNKLVIKMALRLMQLPQKSRWIVVDRGGKQP